MDKKNIFSKIKLLPAEVLIISILLILLIIYTLIKFNNISNQIAILATNVSTLESKFASTTDELRTNINKNSNSIADALNQQRQSVGDITQKLSVYSQEVGSYSSTVTTLQKLSKTDPELLAKYSKVFFLNENYAPARLTEIPNDYKYVNSKPLKISSQVWPYLEKMVNDAKSANNLLYVESAYRSFNEQKALKGQYSIVYGAGTANTFSADQGYSEHQLGTTLDITTAGIGASLEGFENTDSYKWLMTNAYKYGFILSYPKNNKFYVFEPWHWRFVGIKLATELHDRNINFYDMDQRSIDEYLVNLFD